MLDQKYIPIFQSECNALSQAVLGSLLKLASTPNDKQELKKLVQSADTIMGNSRFLNDANLEKCSAMIVKSFGNVSDVRKKIEEFGTAFEQFGLLVGSNGTCPKGYVLVDGKCVLDLASAVKKSVNSGCT